MQIHPGFDELQAAVLNIGQPLQIGHQAREPLDFLLAALQPFGGRFPNSLDHRFQM